MTAFRTIYLDYAELTEQLRAWAKAHPDFPIQNLPLGVFPASRAERTLARLAELFPALRPCGDALDAALTNAGPVIHPPLVLLNAGPIDGGRFDIHAAGTTPSRSGSTPCSSASAASMG